MILMYIKKVQLLAHFQPQHIYFFYTHTRLKATLYKLEVMEASRVITKQAGNSALHFYMVG